MALETFTIGDPQSGSSASVLPGYGMNCFRFQVRRGDRLIDILWSERDFATGQQRPSGSGIPILFPFPGRIREAEFLWGEEQYALNANDGQGNAIHGFVLDRPWRMVQHSDRAVVGQFQASVDDPPLLDRWPADFRITATYQMVDQSLKATYLIENPGERPLPCGLGTHPYFRVPIGGSSADLCRVTLPVTRQWQLDGLIPTGEQGPVTQPGSNLRRGIQLGEMQFDHVFGGLEFRGDQCTARIDDPGSGIAVSLTFDRAFGTCVVYNPPHREAVCIEPYTCLPDPLRLTAEGVDAGLLVLDPGDGVEAKVEIKVESGPAATE